MVLEEEGLLQQFCLSQAAVVGAGAVECAPVRKIQNRRRDGMAPVASQLLCSLVQALRAPCCKA